MKKTLTVNLNGRVFNIDEDAYGLLENYLRNLKMYFAREEGCAEIVDDFEARIEELFGECLRPGHEVITVEDTDAVIARVGKPEDFEDGTGPENEASGNAKTQSAAFTASEKGEKKKKMYRDVDDKMLGGVCSGIASYFSVDVVPIRIVCVILVLIPYGTIVWLYLLLWLILPGAKTAQQKLEMRGEEVSVENIGKVVSERAAAAEKKNGKNEGFAGSLLNFIVTIFKICLVGMGIVVGIPLVFVFVMFMAMAIAVLLGVSGCLLSVPLDFFGFEPMSYLSGVDPSMLIASMILVIFLTGIPLLLLVYALIARLAKLAPVPRSVKVTSLIVWLISFVMLIAFGMMAYFAAVQKNEITHTQEPQVVSENTEGGGKNITVEKFDAVEVGKGLVADIVLEQDTVDSPRLIIAGTDDAIANIGWRMDGTKIYIYPIDKSRQKVSRSVQIHLKTASLREVEMAAAGNFNIPRRVQADQLSIKIEGVGKFQADSLYSNAFSIDMEGAGSVLVKGKTVKAHYDLQGVGKIEAAELEADEVVASVEGVGSIFCNPLQKLEAKVEGVGKVLYKTEPAFKNALTLGVGKIEKSR